MNLSAEWALNLAKRPRAHPNSRCPFCRANNQMTVLRETANFCLVKAIGKNDDYLVIPNRHVVNLDALPGGWGEELADMAKYVREELWCSPKEGHYNVSLNIGRRAGRRIRHLHWWLINRKRGPINGLGLSTLALIQQFFPGIIRYWTRQL